MYDHTLSASDVVRHSFQVGTNHDLEIKDNFACLRNMQQAQPTYHLSNQLLFYELPIIGKNDDEDIHRNGTKSRWKTCHNRYVHRWMINESENLTNKRKQCGELLELYEF